MPDRSVGDGLDLAAGEMLLMLLCIDDSPAMEVSIVGFEASVETPGSVRMLRL